MNQGVRPNKLWHWAAIVTIATTAVHNPGGTAEFAITALDKAGTGIGWALDRGGFDGESDYFTDPNAPEPDSPDVTDPGQPDGQDDEAAGSSGVGLEGTADRVVVEIVELHELIEATLAQDPTPGAQ